MPPLVDIHQEIHNHADDLTKVVELLTNQQHRNDAVDVAKQTSSGKEWMPDGWLPLHHALWWWCGSGGGGRGRRRTATKGVYDLVRLLIELYPEGVLTKDGNSGCLPIHLMTTMMISPDDKDQKNSDDEEYVQTLRLLLEQQPQSVQEPNNQNGCGWLPLHYAAAYGNVPATKVLLEAYPEGAYVEAADGSGWLPIHAVCGYFTYYTSTNNGSFHVLRCLLQEHPEGARHTTIDGNLPIHLALQQSQQYHNNATTNTIPFLSLAGHQDEPDDDDDNNDNENDEPWMLEMVRLLVESYPESPHVRNNDGKLPKDVMGGNFVVSNDVQEYIRKQSLGCTCCMFSFDCIGL